MLAVKNESFTWNSRAILNFRAVAESWTHVIEMSNTVDELGVVNYTQRLNNNHGVLIFWLPVHLYNFN